MITQTNENCPIHGSKARKTETKSNDTDSVGQLRAIANQTDLTKQLMQSVVYNTKPKTTLEALDDIRATSTPAEWRDIVNARIEVASLQECADADAQSQGFLDYADMVNKTGSAAIMKKADDMIKQDQAQKQLEATAREKERLLEAASKL